MNIQKVKTFLIILISIPLFCLVFIIGKQYFVGYFFGYKKVTIVNSGFVSGIIKKDSIGSINEMFANRSSDSLCFLSYGNNKEMVVWKFKRYENLSLSDILFSKQSISKEDNVIYDNIANTSVGIGVLSRVFSNNASKIFLDFSEANLTNEIVNKNYIFCNVDQFKGLQLGNEDLSLENLVACFSNNNSANIVICKRNKELYLILLLSKNLLGRELLDVTLL